MTAFSWEHAGLWSAVLASGIYHGLNPAMGWPLAVSNGLLARQDRAVVSALGWLALGHLLAMIAVMLPFGVLAMVVRWQAPLQFAAGLLVIGWGLALLAWRRHPRALARIAPSRLALWSFAVAIAHGAGLMLVPIYLGLCRADEDAGHEAAATLMGANVSMALLVSVVHATAMIATGGLVAWLVYRYVGLKFVSRTWFNLDVVWALSLVLVGGLALAFSGIQLPSPR
ncbi:hypothetical protein [Cupriavidus sp. amp6]|uniref:hypothetical protein n=2 Tax=Cupriavidus TaxID=106589 RepID=UPI000405D43F|nr:hypothetical protein [Cupriavidus sp. AcVe19-1a]MBP0636040.1 hypothetical protein [Cupriavidus sp. AcVe19-6a]